MSKSKLRSCPFCGGEATVERIGKSGYYYVACNTAYCCDFGKFDTEAEAAEAWNTRSVTAAAVMGYEAALAERTCEFKPLNGEDLEEQNSVRGICSECCALMHGKDSYCPNCGAKVIGG